MKQIEYPFYLKISLQKGNYLEFVKLLNERDCVVVYIEKMNKREYAKVAEESSADFYINKYQDGNKYYVRDMEEMKISTEAEFKESYKKAIDLITKKV